MPLRGGAAALLEHEVFDRDVASPRSTRLVTLGPMPVPHRRPGALAWDTPCTTATRDGRRLPSLGVTRPVARAPLVAIEHPVIHGPVAPAGARPGTR
jgi:hypothetical protein